MPEGGYECRRDDKGTRGNVGVKYEGQKRWREDESPRRMKEELDGG